MNDFFRTTDKYLRKCDTKEIQEKSVQTEGMIFANVDGTEKMKRNRK